jgi:hypothetical protein
MRDFITVWLFLLQKSGIWRKKVPVRCIIALLLATALLHAADPKIQAAAFYWDATSVAVVVGKFTWSAWLGKVANSCDFCTECRAGRRGSFEHPPFQPHSTAAVPTQRFWPRVRPTYPTTTFGLISRRSAATGALQFFFRPSNMEFHSGAN